MISGELGRHFGTQAVQFGHGDDANFVRHDLSEGHPIASWGRE